MLKRILPVGVVLVISAIDLGCTGSKSSSSNTASAAATVVTITTLDGTWQTPCSNGGNGPVSALIKDVNSAGSMVVNITVYSDAGCTTAEAQEVQTSTVDLTGPSDVVSGAYDLTLTLNSFTFTPLNADGLAYAYSGANGSKNDCNGTPFAIGQAGLFTCQQPAKTYSLIMYNGTNLFTLGLNDSAHDGTSPATRPVQMNPNLTYSK